MDGTRNPDEPAPLGDHDLNTDDLFDALSNERRRFVLACLRKHATPMALADVSEKLARREHDGDEGQIPSEVIRSTYLSLHHVHVPKLADVGLLHYNRERNTVAPTEPIDDLPTSVLPGE